MLADVFKDLDVHDPKLTIAYNKKEVNRFNEFFDNKTYDPMISSTSLLCTADPLDASLGKDTRLMEVIGNHCAWITNWAFSYRGISETKTEYDFIEALEGLPAGVLVHSPYISAQSPFASFIVRINSDYTIFLHKDYIIDRVAFGILDTKRLTMTSCISVVHIDEIMKPIGGISMYKELITGNLE